MPQQWKFRVRDRVLHVRSGREYVIVGSPAVYRLEASNKPAYAYKARKGSPTIWVRFYHEMEDGRFTLIHAYKQREPKQARLDRLLAEQEVREDLCTRMICSECSTPYTLEVDEEIPPSRCSLCGGEWLSVAPKSHNRRRR